MTVCACSVVVGTNGLSGGTGQDGGGGALDGAEDAAVADSAPSDTSVADSAVDDAGRAAFLDSFSRADGPIGNGWIEKDPGTLAIAGQRVSVRFAAGYHDAIVYRPATEDIADVEVSQVVDVTTFSGTYAQVHARVQSQTVAQRGVLDSYALYVSAAPDEVLISRTRGTDGALTLANVALSTPLAAGQRFRLRLRVTGSSPVKLEGFVERVLAGGAVTVIGQQTFIDSDTMRLDGAGSVGFSADTGTSYFYDDFTRTPL